MSMVVLACGVLKWLVPIPVLLLLSVTGKGGASQACAACKYQRRRCTPECALAPFFPSEQPRMFQNAHRLYGVANMMRILKHVPEEHKDDAMNSIKYESNMWEHHPSKGCCDVIDRLGLQARAHLAEIHYVQALIQMVRRSPSPWAHLNQLSINNPNCGEGTSHDGEMKPLWAQQQRQLQAQMASRYDGFVSEAFDDTQSSYTEPKKEYDLSRCSNGSSSLNVGMQSTISSQDELKSAPPWFTHFSLLPTDDQDH